MSKLIELAARCEQATGPDRSIDYAIEPLIVIAGQEPPFGIAIPAYTASLDAAMTLVPEGKRIDAIFNFGDGPQRVYISDPHVKSAAATPALALCAAALRARASLDIDVGENG